MLEDTEKPPTSKEEADARRVRPPPEKYDPDKLPDWSITMTVAWIIWREIDAVRNECDDYREKCSDWNEPCPPPASRQRPLRNSGQKKLQKELKECAMGPSAMGILWMEGITFKGESGEPATSRDR